MRNWSIVRKLSVVLLLVALIPMIFIAVFNLQNRLQERGETQERNLGLLAVSIASRMDQLLADNQAAVLQAASNRELARFLAFPEQQPELRPSLEETLQGTLESNPFFEYVYVMDANGDTVFSRQLEGLTSIEGRNFGDRTYFLEAMAGSSYIDILVGRASRRMGFYFSTPIHAGDGTIVGVVIIKLQGEAITEVINEFNKESETVFAFLIDQDGIFVSHRNEDWLMSSTVPLDRETELRVGQRFVLEGCDDAENLDDCTVQSQDVPILAEIVNATQAGNIRYNWPEDGSADAGAPQVVGYAPFEAIGWVVGVNEAGAQLQEALIQLYQETGISVLVVGIVVTFIALRLAQGIARPIGKLAAAAQAVEEDQPFEPSDIADVTAQGDEVGNLARVFSAMVVALRARMAELRTVYQIGQDITATLEAEETLAALLDRVQDVIAYHAAEITLFDRRENALIVTAWNGVDEFTDSKGKQYTLGKGAVCKMGQELQSILLDDISAPSEGEGDTEPLFEEENVKSLLGVPLLIRDRLVGTVELLSSDVAAFTEDDRRLLETIAPQAAIAIEKAQQVREREQKLKNEIKQLRIEIDEAKRQKQVDQIVGTDYFQRLSQKARDLRQRTRDKDKE